MSNFYNEVKTQPEALLSMLSVFKGENYSSLEKGAEIIKNAEKVVFSGMGTSFFAPSCIISEIRKIKPCFVIEASEMERDGTYLMNPQDALVLISQSGESIELVKSIEILKGRVPIVSITNDPCSTLALNGDAVILLNAGEERSITNKTFTNTMAVLYILSDLVSGKSLEKAVSILENAATEMKELIECRMQEVKDIASFLSPADSIHFVGRKGVSMAIANQSGLVFMEGASCNARAFSSGAFRHGPIEICSDKHRMVMYDCIEDEVSVMKTLATQVTSHGSHLCIVSSRMDSPGKVFRIKNSEPRAYSMVAAVFMELLLIEVASMRGKIAGEFSITNKICIME